MLKNLNIWVIKKKMRFFSYMSVSIMKIDMAIGKYFINKVEVCWKKLIEVEGPPPPKE